MGEGESEGGREGRGKGGREIEVRRMGGRKGMVGRKWEERKK